jgi:hypothetical protein
MGADPVMTDLLSQLAIGRDQNTQGSELPFGKTPSLPVLKRIAKALGVPGGGTAGVKGYQS